LCALAFWRPRITAFVFGLLAGFLGLFYLVLWIGSDYTFLHRNFNMINFPPTHLALAAVALRKTWWERSSARRGAYLYVCAAALLLLLLAFGTGLVAQAVGPMLAVSIPIVASLLLSRRYGLGRSSPVAGGGL